MINRKGLIDIINVDCEINKIESPFEIWVLDNFLKKEELETIHKYWPLTIDSRWQSGYSTINGKNNILEKGLRAISKLKDIPEELQEVFNFFHTDEFTEYVSKITNNNSLVSDKSMRWSGLRIMPPNSSQKIHSDARIHPTNNLRKEITCLLYLNKDYNRIRDEGCLEIWDDEMKTCMHEIEPINNRLVLFLNNDMSYHGVPLVKSERKAITWSILSTKSALSHRSKALFVPRPFDSEEIKELGIERSKI
jgi:hypothetical protein